MSCVDGLARRRAGDLVFQPLQRGADLVPDVAMPPVSALVFLQNGAGARSGQTRLSRFCEMHRD